MKATELESLLAGKLSASFPDCTMEQTRAPEHVQSKPLGFVVKLRCALERGEVWTRVEKLIRQAERKIDIEHLHSSTMGDRFQMLTRVEKGRHRCQICIWEMMTADPPEFSITLIDRSDEEK